MGRLIDSVVVWMVCIVFMGAGGLREFSIAALLVTLIGLCVCQVVRVPAIRAAAALALAALCACWQPAVCFLPVAACLCVAEKPPFVRVGWVVAWCVVVARQGMAEALPLLLLCAAAAVLAWRTAFITDRERTILASDNLIRKRARGLAERNRAIEDELEGRHVAATEPVVDPLEGLTDRERQVATLVAEGMDNRAIAAQLYLSEGTVRNNISAILQKKQLKNRTQLAVLALQGTVG